MKAASQAGAVFIPSGSCDCPSTMPRTICAPSNARGANTPKAPWASLERRVRSLEVVFSRAHPVWIESGCALDSCVVACPFRKTGAHFSGTCSRTEHVQAATPVLRLRFLIFPARDNLYWKQSGLAAAGRDDANGLYASSRSASTFRLNGLRS